MLLIASMQLVLAVTAVRAQLMHAEFTGPITRTGRNDLSQLSPGLSLGSPMHLSFVYPSDLEPRTPRGGGGVEYSDFGGAALGSLKVGNFSDQLDNVSVLLIRDTEFQVDSGLMTRGDLMFFETTDSPRGDPSFVIRADLLYPTGTFTSDDLIMPPPNPLLTRLGFGVGYREEGVIGTSLQIFGDLPPLTPVPESETFAFAAAAALIGAVAVRILRSADKAEF